MTENKYITVLDFETSRVSQYEIAETIDWAIDGDEWCEEFIDQQGHNLSSCQWMVHDNPEITN